METLNGKTQEEVRVILNAFLGSEAYTEIPHASYLTEIDPAFLRERLTDAFGIAGYGWWQEIDREDLKVSEEIKDGKSGKYKNFTATIQIARFYFRYREESKGEILTSAPILSAGSSDNRDPGSAIKGAMTNALGSAGKLLLWQLDVYKGLLTHRTAGAREGAGKNGKPGQKPKPSPGMKADLGTLRATAMTDPNEVGPTEFWGFAKIAGIDKELGLQIREEVQSWADALIVAIDQYGGLLKVEEAEEKESSDG